jgi:hypothetical protein
MLENYLCLDISLAQVAIKILSKKFLTYLKIELSSFLSIKSQYGFFSLQQINQI